MNSLNIKFQDRPRQINKGPCNTRRSESALMKARLKLEKDLLDSDKRGQKGAKSRERDKIMQVVRRDSNFEAIVYYHIIYRY